jgi:hypothetical protein
VFGLVTSLLSTIFEGIPPLRALWRNVVERKLEVEIKGTEFLGKQRPPEFSVALEDSPGLIPSLPALIAADFALLLLNHRPDRPERLRRAWLEVKRRRWWFWRSTMIRVPVLQRTTQQDLPVGDVLLEPMGSPVEVSCRVMGFLDSSLKRTVPRRSELWLVLDMVGPIRKIQRKIDDLVRD